MTVVDVLVRGAKKEVEHLIDFATTPMGPFSTVDKMVATARGTVRDVASEVGVRVPFRGQLIRRPAFLKRRRLLPY